MGDNWPFVKSQSRWGWRVCLAAVLYPLGKSVVIGIRRRIEASSVPKSDTRELFEAEGARRISLNSSNPDNSESLSIPLSPPTLDCSHLYSSVATGRAL